MKMPPFEYACPTTLSEAVALLAASDGDAKVLAGGQSLVPMLAFRLAAPSLLVDLRKLAELRTIRITDEGVALGARVRWRDIEDDARLRTAHPLLLAAVDHVAHYQIRNRGTVGGSIAHADPAAEMPGIAVTCDAEITVVGRRRARHRGGGFLPRPADDGARAGRDHHARSACRRGPHGGAGDSRNSPAAAAISRWRLRRCSTTRMARQGAQRPCRRDRRRRPAAAAARGRGRAQRQGRSTTATIAQRRSGGVRRRRSADDIHASAAYRRRWSAPWSSAR